MPSFLGALSSAADQVMQGVAPWELSKKFPDENHRWNGSIEGREPRKDEREWQRCVEDLEKQIGDKAKVVCCVVQLGFAEGCCPACWGLNAVAAWLYRRGLLQNLLPVKGVYRPLTDGRENQDRDPNNDRGSGGGGVNSRAGSHRSRLLAIIVRAFVA